MKKNGTGRRTVIAAAAVLLLMLLCFLLRPWYRNYIAEDNAETCQRYRLLISQQYEKEMQELLDKGRTLEEIDTKQVILQSAEDAYGTDLSEDLSVSGICRSGGNITFSSDPVTGQLYTACTIHGEYTHEMSFGR